MARPGVTYLDIAKTATSLVEQGHYPSIEAVRHALGTGSNGTISRYLKAWRDKQGNRLEAEQGLPETLLVAIKGLYDGIKEQASQQMIAVEQEAKQRLSEMEKNLAEALRAHELLLKEHQTVETHLNMEQAQVKKLQLEITQRDQIIDSGKADNHLLKTRLTDKTEELARLFAQVLQAQTNFEHYTEATCTQREEERQRFEVQIKTLEMKEQHNQEVIARQQQSAAVQSKEQALLQAEKNYCDESFSKTQQVLQALQLELEALKNQHTQLQSQHSFAVNQHEKLVVELNLLGSRYQDLQANFAANTERLQMTETARQKAEDELLLLRDKLLFLTHEKAQLQTQLETR
ncbi:MAG: DNA-binding protein [Gammaproteobacteria bacterium]